MSDDRQDWRERAIQAFTELGTAATPQAVRQVLADYPELLDKQLDRYITGIIGRAWAAREHAENGDTNKLIVSDFLASRFFLKCCHAYGIDAALARSAALPLAANSPLGRLLETSYDKSDLAQRAELARQALELVRRSDEPDLWATLHRELGDYLAQSDGADRSERIEQALRHFRLALRIWNRPPYYRSPVWAQTKHALAATYRRRVAGARAENLSQALVLYNEALEVRSERDFPAEWAETQHDLGALYLELPAADRRANVEQAIAYYQHALAVRKRLRLNDVLPYTLHDLAIAQTQHPDLGRTEYLEPTITSLQALLAPPLAQREPCAMGRAHVALGNAFVIRIRDDRTLNIAQAIKHYDEALKIFAGHCAPADQAGALYNMAVAYWHRPDGLRTENIRRAIEYCKQALRIFTSAAYRSERARVLAALGNLYSQDRSDRRAKYQELAIRCYKEALALRPRSDDPAAWATLQDSLGNVYGERIKGIRAINQRRAIGHYQRALTVRTREASPERWAETANNLGVTYSEMAATSARWRDRAIEYLRQALEVHKPEVFPHDARRAARNMAGLLFSRGDWEDAAEYYATAIRATELLYKAAVAEPSRHAELAESTEIFVNRAYALAHTEKPDALLQAVECLEAGRARALIESLELQQIADEGLDQAQRARRAEIVNQIRGLESLLRDGKQPLTAVADRLKELWSELPDFQKPIDFRSLATGATAQRPLVYLIVTPHGGMGLIVRRRWLQATVEPVPMPDFTSRVLDDLLGIDANGNLTEGYLLGQLGDPALLKQALVNILPVLGQLLIEPLAEHLRALGASGVTLIAGGRLSLLPLHAALYQHAGSTIALLDEFAVAYAPGARVLAKAGASSTQRRGTLHLAGVGNPLPAGETAETWALSLHHAKAELESIVSLIPQHTTALYEQKATHAALLRELTQATVAHLACHGQYDPKQPTQSGLLLADNRLTLGEILAADFRAMKRMRLAVLSACQTAITDFATLPDEAIGLPGGFLQAGVPAVIGSLWSVDDASTALLMLRCYELMLHDRRTASEALRQAQRWLRDQTKQNLKAYLDHHRELERARRRAMPRMSLELIQALRMNIMADDEDAQPYASPYFWAAFTFHGAAEVRI